MNTTKASCGCTITAVGDPGSMAREAQEKWWNCGKPRCESRLPAKFTDRECAAYVWLHQRCIRGWVVDMITKKVTCYVQAEDFPSLIEAAQHFGWEG